MKKYTEAVKEKENNFQYLVCENKHVFENDLGIREVIISNYHRSWGNIKFPCPICEEDMNFVSSEKGMTENQIIELAKQYGGNKMKKIYKMYLECGRMGELESVFIEEEERMEALIGKELYFGEVLGKHSEIYGKLEENEIIVLSEDQNAIKIIEDLNILPTGYYPFNYYTCDSCGYSLDPITDVCDYCSKEDKE